MSAFNQNFVNNFPSWCKDYTQELQSREKAHDILNLKSKNVFECLEQCHELSSYQIRINWIWSRLAFDSRAERVWSFYKRYKTRDYDYLLYIFEIDSALNQTFHSNLSKLNPTEYKGKLNTLTSYFSEIIKIIKELELPIGYFSYLDNKIIDEMCSKLDMSEKYKNKNRVDADYISTSPRDVIMAYLPNFDEILSFFITEAEKNYGDAPIVKRPNSLNSQIKIFEIRLFHSFMWIFKKPNYEIISIISEILFDDCFDAVFNTEATRKRINGG